MCMDDGQITFICLPLAMRIRLHVNPDVTNLGMVYQVYHVIETYNSNVTSGFHNIEQMIAQKIFYTVKSYSSKLV
ncbi:hypothetical protein WN51_00708 [Melipona quadrifasciata]|uniref:Uncharacterized protein n=1 Tax=Melipona quadrifasciata TaxID=166423 RepID=A0A0N0BF30_9HYME|nr:hypothetical protein WN51_00708 [Melipona quadrifasciata]